MSVKRILCVGDSLALPREGISFDETWVYLLGKLNSQWEIVNVSRRGLTSADIVSHNSKDFLEYYNPQIVVLQIGIVDCAPRYLKKKSIILRLLNISPKQIQNFVWRLIKKYFKRKPAYADVPKQEFEKHLSGFFMRCESVGVKKIIVLQIGKPGQAMLSQSPLIINQINDYNLIIAKVAKNFCSSHILNPLADGLSENYIEDGYHISVIGAKKIAIEVSNSILKRDNCEEVSEK